MNNKESFIVYDGVEVPAPALLSRQKGNRYGIVPGLDDEELADPDELERQIYREELGHLLMLPKPKACRFNPAWDFSTDVDFNAFASVDFERTQPEFDKLRYKADKLKEQRKDLIIMIAMLRARIAFKAKDRVLKYVGMGIIEVDDIKDWDMWQCAKLYLRALGISKEIKRLEENCQDKKAERLQKWFDHLDKLAEQG